jgi:hypothetical protein
MKLESRNTREMKTVYRAVESPISALISWLHNTQAWNSGFWLWVQGNYVISEKGFSHPRGRTRRHRVPDTLSGSGLSNNICSACDSCRVSHKSGQAEYRCSDLRWNPRAWSAQVQRPQKSVGLFDCRRMPTTRQAI